MSKRQRSKLEIQTLIEKTLDSGTAWVEWMKRIKGNMKFKGTLKYTLDHLLTLNNLSKKNVHEAAVDRYVRDRSTRPTTYTYMSSSEADLVKKAGRTKPADWKANVHGGKQQLFVKVKIETWTVDVKEVKKKEALNVKSQKKFNIIERDRGKRYFIVSKPSTVRSSHAVIAGEWNPMKGEATLYHFNANPMPTTHGFMAKYLVWWCECDDRGKIQKIKKPKVKS